MRACPQTSTSTSFSIRRRTQDGPHQRLTVDATPLPRPLYANVGLMAQPCGVLPFAEQAIAPDSSAAQKPWGGPSDTTWRFPTRTPSGFHSGRWGNQLMTFLASISRSCERTSDSSPRDDVRGKCIAGAISLTGFVGRFVGAPPTRPSGGVGRRVRLLGGPIPRG